MLILGFTGLKINLFLLKRGFLRIRCASDLKGIHALFISMHKKQVRAIGKR